MLASFEEVERALTRYGDAHEAATRCVARAGHREAGSLFRAAPFDDAEMFVDLQARMMLLKPEERFVLEWWYRGGLDPRLIARDLRRSVRHVYRTRRAAISRLVDVGRDNEFSNADVAEFR